LIAAFREARTSGREAARTPKELEGAAAKRTRARKPFLEAQRREETFTKTAGKKLLTRLCAPEADQTLDSHHKGKAAK
tara:strand:- start:4276 stop:4509 length:234 start_codon:yes stop_codon:yes gene_type:complete